jgi:hypothetical protein
MGDIRNAVRGQRRNEKMSKATIAIAAIVVAAIVAGGAYYYFFMMEKTITFEPGDAGGTVYDASCYTIKHDGETITGPVKIAPGESYTFTITGIKSGWAIDKVNVNRAGSGTTELTAVAGVYTLTDVTSNTTVFINLK